MRYRSLICCLVLALAAPLAASSTASAEELRYQKDLDRDGTLETIVVKEVYDLPESTDSSPRQPIETSISIRKSNGSLVAEGRVVNGKPKISFVSLNADQRQQIVVRTMGGQHYSSLTIFDYRGGKLTPLFSNGSACEVEEDFKAKPPTIRVGRANWDDPQWNYAAGKRLWNVYVWNGKTFVFNAAKSTAQEIREDEEVARFVGEVSK